MDALLGFIMVVGILSIAVAVIAIIFSIITKKRKRFWGKIFVVGLILFIIPLVIYFISTSPEKRALIQQQRIEETNKGIPTANNSPLQKDNQENETKNIYDEQAEYEEWIPKEIDLLCRQSLKENFLSVDVKENFGKMDGSKIVIVHYKAMNAYSEEQQRRALMIQASSIMCSLYSSELPISEVTLFSEADLIDKYGKSKSENVMKCSLSSDTAKKINWEYAKNMNIEFEKMLDSLWYHPSIRRK